MKPNDADAMNESSPAYDNLRRRAHTALRGTPGGLSDGELAAAMFGGATGPASGALVRAILEADPRFERAAGRWSLVGRSSARHPPEHASHPHQQERIITLALATTGADPHLHQIVRIAAIRLDGDQITARLDSHVRPQHQLPGYLQSAIRTTNDDLDAAPAFSEVWAQLSEVVGDEPVFVYGARRASKFLAAGAARAGAPGPQFTLLEADSQIRPYLPAGAKPGLLAAARELAIPYPRAGAPISDAETLARVIRQLRMRGRVAPPRTDRDTHDEDLGADQPVSSLPFTRAWLADVPDLPGVYLLEDAAGAVLYVGKAHSLSRRLTSYVQRQPSANRQLEALAVRAARARMIPTPSDLEATLLEARLIRRHTPAFNVAQAVRPPRVILRAGLDDPSPRLQLVPEAKPDGARYYGPMASSRVAQAALETVRAVFPDAVARRRGDRDAQRAAVLEACTLLSGQKASSISVLQREMQAAAARGDQVEVDRLRTSLRDVQALDVQPSLLMGLRPGTELVVLEYVLDGLTRAHLLRDGVRLVSVSWDIDFLPADAARLRSLADAMLAATEVARDDGFDQDDDADVSAPNEPTHPDEPAIVMRWLLQARTRIELAIVPPADD